MVMNLFLDLNYLGSLACLYQVASSYLCISAKHFGMETNPVIRDKKPSLIKNVLLESTSITYGQTQALDKVEQSKEIPFSSQH